MRNALHQEQVRVCNLVSVGYMFDEQLLRILVEQRFLRFFREAGGVPDLH